MYCKQYIFFNFISSLHRSLLQWSQLVHVEDVVEIVGGEVSVEFPLHLIQEVRQVVVVLGQEHLVVVGHGDVLVLVHVPGVKSRLRDSIASLNLV